MRSRGSRGNVGRELSRDRLLTVVLSRLVCFHSRWCLSGLPGFGDRLHVSGQNPRG